MGPCCKRYVFSRGFRSDAHEESQMVTSEKHQKALLGGIERHAGLAHPELIPAIPKILMALYQIDVLDEEVVTQWGTHVSKKYVDKDTSKKVRKASEPFLKVRSSETTRRSSIFTHSLSSGLKRLMTMMMRMKSRCDACVLVQHHYLADFPS